MRMKRTVEYIKDKTGKTTGILLLAGHEWDEVDDLRHRMAKWEEEINFVRSVYWKSEGLEERIKDLEEPETWKVKIQRWFREKIDAMQDWHS